ncbi:hypothetical protein SARC_12286 [Sphaeroforma arctica JP610]|uniref:AGC-kinase C-terminal domain-containing protein n=1 Tax=Sphaeroforma arctica JP610 TaxID=667725 RepID=A0A0L0FEL3_9EUKA|nr:hypothetical protein SARC_12286 [Sphaeroforma arctica JP610]KNC75185.1 hypothetical protein SARC_12286 [Sphaeroforma arctica JP610]|eukprot:XP_014149087.1 hypothetical protein SARC_12286 [Sphaeroforma arctica JP610]
MSYEAYDLINQLLNRTPTARPSLGQMKQHPFFHDIQWDKLLLSPGPFIPSPGDGEDTKYFCVREGEASGAGDQPTRYSMVDNAPSTPQEDTDVNDDKMEVDDIAEVANIDAGIFNSFDEKVAHNLQGMNGQMVKHIRQRRAQSLASVKNRNIKEDDANPSHITSVKRTVSSQHPGMKMPVLPDYGL